MSKRQNVAQTSKPAGVGGFNVYEIKNKLVGTSFFSIFSIVQQYNRAFSRHFPLVVKFRNPIIN